jgi:hypothetical protein
MSALPHADAARCCAVVELRQYTLHRGRRDALIDLFDREFVESQEALGIAVLGQFRDLGDADRFVWLRGFAGMPARRAALQAFYGGPVWQRHRDAANATMIDSDDVLLLRPAFAGSGFVHDAARRGRRGAAHGVVTATIRTYAAAPDGETLAHFRRRIAPAIERSGGELLAVLVTEAAINDYPRLPVREGEHVLAWFARFGDAAASARYASERASSPDASRQRVLREATLLLQPTSRSLLGQER